MSKENALEFRYEWKIHNFSVDFYKNGESIESPTFEINSFGGSQWCLELFPCGEVEKDAYYVSVFLYKKRSDIYSNVSNIIYDIELIGDAGDLMNSKLSSGSKEFKLNSRHGFSRVVSVSTLEDHLKKWPESVLTVRCSMLDTRKRRPFDLEMHTDVPIKQCSFLWTIKISDISSSQTVSKEFSFSENSLYVITLSMFEEDKKIKININKKKEESPFSKYVECKLSLINSKTNERISERASHCFELNEKNDTWNFPSFITEGHLYSKSDLWGNGNFSLFCEFVASDGIKSTPIISSKYATVNADDHSVLREDFKSMLRNHIHSDIQFKVGKAVIHAHKAILAARSPTFLAMFDSNMLESQTGVVSILDFEENVLKAFLEFIYTGTVENFDYEKAKNLIMVANKYQVQSLKEKCAFFLEAILALGNAIEILSIADMINHKHLKEAAIGLIALNSEVIFKTPEWHDCVRGNIKLAGEIISVITGNFKIIPIYPSSISSSDVHRIFECPPTKRIRFEEEEILY